jgi:hypothetical protein
MYWATGQKLLLQLGNEECYLGANVCDVDFSDSLFSETFTYIKS